ncbi:hypothetical protein HNQ36_002728 [Afipia massiliensis]|uniref:Uncharacterized protein n=1 Tax=Afipia massiliensis TaxID=211460 RepID=A0A840N296_9BRAD|nr:hypothetical protein [Afipia massiliensis]
MVSFRLRHRLRGDELPEAHRLAALHCGILGEGTVLPGEDGRSHVPIRPAFAAFILAASSRERQSHIVGPDGDPSLPDDVCARHACRRRILFRFKAPSRSAPHEQDAPNIRAVQSAGIRIPITKCFGRPGTHDPYCARTTYPPSFRGARLRASPESTSNEILQSWIPGLRQEAHPGMTSSN